MGDFCLWFSLLVGAFPLVLIRVSENEDDDKDEIRVDNHPNYLDQCLN